jgi:hypothetical protein
VDISSSSSAKDDFSLGLPLLASRAFVLATIGPVRPALGLECFGVGLEEIDRLLRMIACNIDKG